MALVTWGVWHTLTQHSHSHTAQPHDSDPKWSREVSPRGKEEGAADNARSSTSQEIARTSIDPAPGNASAAGAGNAVIGAFDPGPPLPAPKEPVREATAPRVGEQTPPAGASQPKEIATASTMSLEAQRLNDQFDTVMKRIKDLIAARQLVPAYEELSSWYPRRDDLTLARSEQMLKELDGLACELVYSPRPHLSPPYSVAGGDTLSRIATPHTVPPELLAKINGVTRPDQIRPGQQLKVVHGPFHAEIRLSKFELTILISNKMLYGGRFRIGLGKEGPHQPGAYTVVKKKMFPEYYPDPKNREHKIPGGDRHNALGTRLIVFVSADGQHDGALHGTIEPTSIGGQCKEGSIRLAQEDIENVYDMLMENESKIIVRN
jgi:LysM repeat protein